MYRGGRQAFFNSRFGYVLRSCVFASLNQSGSYVQGAKFPQYR